MRINPVCYFGVPNVPLIEPGDDLAALVADALRASDLGLVDGDILVVTQKVVSKAEGRYVERDTITPSPRAIEIARATGKDAKSVEAILSESTDIIRTAPNLVIAVHRLGFVMANAGIDESNITYGDGAGRLLLLPREPDASAAQLKQRLDHAFGVSIGIVISDSFGRPWRNGVVGVALGAAGVPALVDRVGTPDLFGRKLKVTHIAIADELASAASLIMGQAAESIPVVLVRGFRLDAPDILASALIRDKESDLFR